VTGVLKSFALTACLLSSAAVALAQIDRDLDNDGLWDR
jgi:hypothetical protein